MTSSRSNPVNFEAVASDAATEVFLIDASLKRIASGVGRLEQKVAPGLYKVRFRSGASQHDELVEVTQSPSRQQLRGEPVPFASAAPIDHSLTTNTEHADAAADLSLQVSPVSGQGTLFLFLRSEDPYLDFDADGVSIHCLGGDQIADLSQAVNDTSNGYAGLTLALDCGSYRIRVRKENLGDYELFATVCKGWQTQVFLSFDAFERRESDIHAASLRRASVFMVRNGQGFNPSSETFRLTELAKQALAQGRSQVSRGLLGRFLNGKFEDPMMGLLAAHLLLQGRRTERSGLTSMVLDNLVGILGAHPDLLALRLAHNPADEDLREFSLSAPPLLSASWKLLSQATRRRAGLISPGSVPGLIAHNVTNGGPWLIYRLQEADGAQPARLSLSEAERRFRKMLDAYGDRLAEVDKRQRSDDARFSGLEQSLLTLMLSEIRLREVRELSKRQRGNVHSERLLRRIRAPAYSVASAVGGLEQKLSRLLG
ncbi:hypothetical protein [uncultured Roseobacter sp.]|uniref:hypothetical protein n=1 Tax=uncultured Roseobacter sp. TaxID=114847 RepID=UPI00260ADD7B|nr:hypothetical protein [uncultured Roseobacter sp.]